MVLSSFLLRRILIIKRWDKIAEREKSFRIEEYSNCSKIDNTKASEHVQSQE